MVHLYKKTLIITSLTLLGIASLNYSSGPALNSTGATGAPFNGQTCGTSCHGGGSFGPTLSMQLLHNNVALANNSNYVPGWVYTLRITRSANINHTLLPNSGFGFQVTSARTNAPTYTNINNWGTMPTLPVGSGSIANRLTGGRNYIEHTTKLAKTVTSIDIPWTAPVAGSGQVGFWMALNTVNGDGNNTGDQVLSASLTFNQAPLSVTWLYFNGNATGENNVLEWATTTEVGNEYFTLEKSLDGINFEELSRVPAAKDPLAIHTYSYADKAASVKTFYRIKQTDVNGVESYFRTILVTNANPLHTVHYVQGNELIVQVEMDNASTVDANIYGLDGRKVASKKVVLNAGANRLALEVPQVPGIYLFTLSDSKLNLYSGRFIVR
jgi:hypothetical protein